MSRRAPRDAPDTAWHVTGCVNWRAWKLAPDQAYKKFIQHLTRVRKEYGVDLIAFVVMSNHYHLVTRSPDEETYTELTTRRTACRHRRPYPRHHYKSQVISQFARDFKLATTTDIQSDLEIEGHLWDGPHHRRRIEDAHDLICTVAYDHRNPVRAGMAACPEHYARSSAAWWARTGDAPCPIATRSDLPFELDREDFRGELLVRQAGKLLDDIVGAVEKRGYDPESARGQRLLRHLLAEAGLRPPEECGSTAALE